MESPCRNSALGFLKKKNRIHSFQFWRILILKNLGVYAEGYFKSNTPAAPVPCDTFWCVLLSVVESSSVKCVGSFTMHVYRFWPTIYFACPTVIKSPASGFKGDWKTRGTPVTSAVRVNGSPFQDSTPAKSQSSQAFSDVKEIHPKERLSTIMFIK